jgi:peptidoglycan-associated lipoprotein
MTTTATYCWLALGAVLAALAGCESPGTLTQPATGAPVETRSTVAGQAAGSTAATTSATPQSRVATVDLARQSAGASNAGSKGAGTAAAVGGTALLSAPGQRVVYFDFDSYVIKDDYKAMLDSHAKALAAARNKHMVVEGHTDDRGGREYNLALGQKRAEAVVKALTLLGATGGQLEATSFGEERPVAQGSDEAAWAKNRRAELKDR